MQELIIKRRDLLHFPEEYNFSQRTANIDKISFHFCSKTSISINIDQFPSLSYIEIIGSRYISLKIHCTKPAKLRAIHIANCDYLDVLDINGDFPEWDLFSAEYCRYLKFKGKFSGYIMLKAISLVDVPNSGLFYGNGVLCNLNFIRITQNSHFFRINLGTVALPKLDHLWIEESNYTAIEDLGDSPRTLRSFRFVNCVYPKFNLDLSKMPWNNAEPGSTDYIEILKLIPEIPHHFRRGKKIARLKRKSKQIQSANIQTSHNNEYGEILEEVSAIEQDLPEMSEEEEKIILSADQTLYRNLQKESDPEEAAHIFLKQGFTPDNELNSKDKEIFHISQTAVKAKYCPKCGIPNIIEASFCARCGESFERDE